MTTQTSTQTTQKPQSLLLMEANKDWEKLYIQTIT